MHSKTPSITKAILADVEIWFKKHYIHLLLCDNMTWFADLCLTLLRKKLHACPTFVYMNV